MLSKPGTIILVNGTSSSGKSSLLKALQTVLPEPFLDAGLDKFLWMLPLRYFAPPLWNDVLGEAVRAGSAGHRLMHGMHHAIAALARSGNNVVADHLLVEPGWLRECEALFKGLPVVFVGPPLPAAGA